MRVLGPCNARSAGPDLSLDHASIGGLQRAARYARVPNLLIAVPADVRRLGVIIPSVGGFGLAWRLDITRSQAAHAVVDWNSSSGRLPMAYGCRKFLRRGQIHQSRVQKDGEKGTERGPKHIIVPFSGEVGLRAFWLFLSALGLHPCRLRGTRAPPLRLASPANS
jgi:hypothetical protein